MNSNKLESILVCDNDIVGLFKIALKLVESGKYVWFISPEPITSLPKNVTPSTKEVLKFLTLLYFKDTRELLKHFNSIQTWFRIPELIIIIDFHHYLDCENNDYNPTESAFLCASFLDAGNACIKKLNKSVYLIASLDLDKCKNKNVQILLDLYFNKISNTSEINI
ncbi:uncharacterized protein [Onthophagus taurus]|uniref:uncharacterized protein n=1 Tax=Onthophagus taurus TaxID=166361 RepID=UPI000C20B6E5|nr:uncharacterized protein LOC111428711 [Onthophagus taurus]